MLIQLVRTLNLCLVKHVCAQTVRHSGVRRTTLKSVPLYDTRLWAPYPLTRSRKCCIRLSSLQVAGYKISHCYALNNILDLLKKVDVFFWDTLQKTLPSCQRICPLVYILFLSEDRPLIWR